MSNCLLLICGDKLVIKSFESNAMVQVKFALIVQTLAGSHLHFWVPQF